MMNNSHVSKLAHPRRRRSALMVAPDINSDFNGRRPTGDPRLDLAGFDRA